MSVRKFLDLSTGHLSPRDREQLTQALAQGTRNAPGNCLVGSYGWMIYAEEEPDPFTWREVPGLAALLARARELDCDYVLLDADGPVDETLPFFDED